MEKWKIGLQRSFMHVNNLLKVIVKEQNCDYVHENLTRVIFQNLFVCLFVALLAPLKWIVADVGPE